MNENVLFIGQNGLPAHDSGVGVVPLLRRDGAILVDPHAIGGQVRVIGLPAVIVQQCAAKIQRAGAVRQTVESVEPDFVLPIGHCQQIPAGFLAAQRQRVGGAAHRKRLVVGFQQIFLPVADAAHRIVRVPLERLCGGQL